MIDEIVSRFPELAEEKDEIDKTIAYIIMDRWAKKAIRCPQCFEMGMMACGRCGTDKKESFLNDIKNEFVQLLGGGRDENK